MARNFDGTNDNISTANNAMTGVDVNQKSYGFWCTRPGNAGGDQIVLTLAVTLGAGGARPSVAHAAPAAAGWKLKYFQNAGTTGIWISDADISNTRHHIAVTYDRGADANDPVFWVDGVSVALTETQAPVTIVTGEDTARFGESATGTQDLAAALQHFSLQPNVLWDAAQVNRSKWWGRPGGGQVLEMPFITAKLANEGSTAVTFSATGTTVTEMPTPVVRRGHALMGMGIGW